MLEFITIPLVVGIITLGIYGLFELFARRRERLALIEKLGALPEPTMMLNHFRLPRMGGKEGFGTLKLACLLLGVGLGLLAGFFLSIAFIGPNELYQESMSWNMREITGVLYGASVLLFGGLGLLSAFVIEQKQLKQEKKQ